ncbi:class I SAM-dependent methyltransferase [Gracilimonas sp.]|uniref:class I SAM-dependent methyltransferase n=1 Tax=Gracilimonas sp. TaxID=1974203 RepID=UPI0028724E3E|nr:class I SAM-dependent methyltransferase [Gracilimonas sp.]
MYEFHKDKDRYFNMQYKTSKEYIVPFVKEFMPNKKPLRILEIGCAEAGVLKAFTELGHQCVGIELSGSRVELARNFMQKEIQDGQIRFIIEDIYDIDPAKEFDELFDLVILKDVIEHIHNQERFMGELKKLIKPDGYVFFAFPPWYMPFGGHQQLANNKVLNKLPYYHILPDGFYRLILKAGKETDQKIEGLLEIKSTGITIEQFQKIAVENDWVINKKKYWLFNPIYQWKFGVKPKGLYPAFQKIPFLRNFWTTAAYFLISVKKRK